MEAGVVGGHWMTTANWENTERPLELKPRDQSANLLHEKVGVIARQLFEQSLQLF